MAHIEGKIKMPWRTLCPCKQYNHKRIGSLDIIGDEKSHPLKNLNKTALMQLDQHYSSVTTALILSNTHCHMLITLTFCSYRSTDQCLLTTNDDVTFKCLGVTDATRNVPVCVCVCVCVCVFVVFAEATTRNMSQMFYVILGNIDNIFAALWNCDRAATEVIYEKYLFFFVISKGHNCGICWVFVLLQLYHPHSVRANMRKCNPPLDSHYLSVMWCLLTVTHWW